MSAADRLRSSRSANENKCRNNGKVPTDGRPGGETAVRHRGRDRSRGRKDVRDSGKDRSSRQHRKGPQPRAKTQTHMLGGEDADAPQKKEAGTEMNYTARPAMAYGCLVGAVNGQRQVTQ